MNLHKRRITEQNGNFKMKVFNLDEEFGQLPCKDVLRVFQLIAQHNCLVEALVLSLIAAPGQVQFSVPPLTLCSSTNRKGQFPDVITITLTKLKYQRIYSAYYITSL